MERFKNILNRRKKDLMALDNVIGVGTGRKYVRNKDTGKDAIVFIVEKKLPARDVRKGNLVPRTLDGVETDVIETGKFYLLGRTDRVRPASPGVSVGHYQVTAGTLGAVVTDNVSGGKVILSNNHILANITNGNDGRAEVGDPILQPGRMDKGQLDTDVIGELLRFVPLDRPVRDPSCPVAQAASRTATRLLRIFRKDYRVNFFKETEAENLVDCAIAKPVREDLITTSVIDLGEITGVGEVEFGQKVRKSGRTSGLTEGQVRATNITIRVNIDKEREAVFADQVMADLLSQPGDSGSIILDENNRAVGLLFAGSNNMTLFNRISNVMELLDISI